MATLRDVDIRDGLRLGSIEIDPLQEKHIQPASVDLTLGTSFFWPRIDNSGYALELPAIKYDSAEHESFVICPGTFLLGSTVERVKLGRALRASVEGKSSLGRCGIMVHVTAGFIDPGFDGNITLELCNLSPNPLRLHAGMRICQIAFQQMTGDVERPYGSKGLGSHYQNQKGATPPRLSTKPPPPQPPPNRIIKESDEKNLQKK